MKAAIIVTRGDDRKHRAIIDTDGTQPAHVAGEVFRVTTETEGDKQPDMQVLRAKARVVARGEQIDPEGVDGLKITTRIE